MRDAVSGLGRIGGKDRHSGFVVAGLQDADWPQRTSLTIAQGATTGERSGEQQQDQVVQGGAVSGLSALYRAHYASLVRVAVLLVGDPARAQKIVEDSYVAMHAHWRRLNEPDTALMFLRRYVIKRSRSVFHRRGTGCLAGPAVVAALRALSRQEREALVLRYYAELPDTQIASVMGVSQAAVQSHTARAMWALRRALEREP
jgi:DNA-directed RNA polymerase specialized sigma24 family protein